MDYFKIKLREEKPCPKCNGTGTISETIVNGESVAFVGRKCDCGKEITVKY